MEGLALLRYDSGRPDGNWQAALGPACAELLQLLGRCRAGRAGLTSKPCAVTEGREAGIQAAPDASAVGHDAPPYAEVLADYLRSHPNALTKPLKTNTMDRGFGWPPGTTDKHLDQVLDVLGYEVVRRAGHLVTVRPKQGSSDQ